MSASRPPVGDRVVAAISRRFGRRIPRRSFLVRTAVFASALAVNPIRYLLRPGTAYASLCGPDAGCGSGWTAMCCTVNGGENSCPPGSVPAGWWKADNTPFCGSAPRYYIDCNSLCANCGCAGGSGLCAPQCVDCSCHCASGTCDERFTCCNEFRYGQCHQDLACVGPIVCRVVSCVPPWDYDPTCTTASATANATALHDAPCLHEFVPSVLGFGAAAFHGAPKTPLPFPIVGIESTPTGAGYWLVASDGGVYNYGDARFYGSMGGHSLAAPIVDIARTVSGRGYWLVAADGGVFSFGDARYLGSMGGHPLAAPIVGMASDPVAAGYWMVAADGGIFSFGSARFHGSMGGTRLNRPVVGMAATATGRGYWLVATDGGVFSFGDAQFEGSDAGLRLNRPVVGMTGTPTGRGYWFVAADGGVSAFGDARYLGGGTTVVHAGSATDIAGRPDGRGYWIATDT